MISAEEAAFLVEPLVLGQQDLKLRAWGKPGSDMPAHLFGDSPEEQLVFNFCALVVHRPMLRALDDNATYLKGYAHSLEQLGI